MVFFLSTNTLMAAPMISSTQYWANITSRVPWMRIEQTLTFPVGTDLSGINVGDRLTQGRSYGTYGAFTAIGVVTAVNTSSSQITIYSTDTSGSFDAGKFTNNMEVYYCPTQATFGVSSTSGSVVNGLADSMNWNLSDYYGKNWETGVIDLVNAKRYLVLLWRSSNWLR